MSDKKIWILVVEDDSTSRKIMANLIHKNGYNAICAENGEQAMETLRFCTPDCILLDLVMPKMHGHAFLTQMRKNNQDMPVIVMSSVESQPELVKAMEKIGIQGWIAKPANPKEVTQKIKDVLGLE